MRNPHIEKRNRKDFSAVKISHWVMMLYSFDSRIFGISHAGIVERRMAKQVLNYCTESIFHKNLAKLSQVIFNFA